MLTTVTLNAAVDVTYTVENFALDQVNRAAEKKEIPGGKGINVARVANTLGCPVQATGFVAGQTGRFIKEKLAEEGISNNFFEIQGESRRCLAIIDPVGNTQTELLESGPEVSQASFAAFQEHLVSITAKSPIVAFSGSLPGGLPADAYAKLIQSLPEKKVILDTSGAALKEGIGARPFMVKPNEDELETFFGRPVRDLPEVLAAGEYLLSLGVEVVVISLGARGAVALSGEERYLATPPTLEPVSTVGCGDSLVAGMAVSFLTGKDLADALRLGSACGAANALVPGAGEAKIADINCILPQVKIEKL